MPLVTEKVLPMSPVHLLPMSPVYTKGGTKGDLIATVAAAIVECISETPHYDTEVATCCWRRAKIQKLATSGDIIAIMVTAMAAASPSPPPCHWPQI